MEQHIVKGFDRDLDKIKDHINKISGLVESQLAYAYQSLNDRDILIAEKVIERDKKIDKLYQELLDMSIQLFALRQPLAIDLRYVISSIKIASDLEKIGDQANNIAKASRWNSKLTVNQKVLSDEVTVNNSEVTNLPNDTTNVQDTISVPTEKKTDDYPGF